ncbi:Uncharacterised protein [Mycobacteroides abscessus subsp. abscessus]|nr:Uncharacterised protein [Mycobacteroides abscessus subsp. abscessus]
MLKRLPLSCTETCMKRFRSVWIVSVTRARDSSVRNTCAFLSISSCSSLRRAETRSVPLLPERLPNTLMSSSEFVPRRFEPCTDTQAHSPAA